MINYYTIIQVLYHYTSIIPLYKYYTIIQIFNDYLRKCTLSISSIARV
jgi:hypothetical protein